MPVPTGFSKPMQLILETEMTGSVFVLQRVNISTEMIAIEPKILIMGKVLLLFKCNFFVFLFRQSLT
jgi:hypothetical protein